MSASERKVIDIPRMHNLGVTVLFSFNQTCNFGQRIKCILVTVFGRMHFL